MTKQELFEEAGFISLEDISEEIINTPDASDVFGDTFRNETRHIIKDVLKTLTPKESIIIQRLFGLDNGREKELHEVGREFSITKERVRQIQVKALRKLKHPSRLRRLRECIL